MDKILELGDVFGREANNFNTLLLIPVVLVVIGSVAVFLCGVAKTEAPNMRKSVSTSSSNNSAKRKKRQVAAVPTAERKQSANKSATLQQSAAQQQQQQQPPPKVASSKNVTSVKNSPEKKSNVSSEAAQKSRVALKNAKATTTKVPKSKVVPAAEANLVEGEGEWQTVLNKKQKKSTDALNQAVGVDAAASVAKKNVKSPKKIKTAKVAVALLPEKEQVAAAAVEEVIEKLAPTLTETAEESVPPTVTEAEPSSVGAPIEVVETVESYVAFDELGDAAFTESKPQKKNKKRALRE